MTPTFLPDVTVVRSDDPTLFLVTLLMLVGWVLLVWRLTR